MEFLEEELNALLEEESDSDDDDDDDDEDVLDREDEEAMGPVVAKAELSDTEVAKTDDDEDGDVKVELPDTEVAKADGDEDGDALDAILVELSDTEDEIRILPQMVWPYRRGFPDAIPFVPTGEDAYLALVPDLAIEPDLAIAPELDPDLEGIGEGASSDDSSLASSTTCAAIRKRRRLK